MPRYRFNVLRPKLPARAARHKTSSKARGYLFRGWCRKANQQSFSDSTQQSKNEQLYLALALHAQIDQRAARYGNIYRHETLERLWNERNSDREVSARHVFPPGATAERVAGLRFEGLAYSQIGRRLGIAKTTARRRFKQFKSAIK